MEKVLENLGVRTIAGKRVFACEKCGQELGPVTGDYKNHAMKREVSLSKNQPRSLAPKTDKYVMREYYCPKCGAMFEVDMVAKEEGQILSVQFNK